MKAEQGGSTGLVWLILIVGGGLFVGLYGMFIWEVVHR